MVILIDNVALALATCSASVGLKIAAPVICVDLRPLEALLEILERMESLDSAFLDLFGQQSMRHNVRTASVLLVQALWGPHVPGEHRLFRFTRMEGDK